MSNLAVSWFEATARQRLAALVDDGSFEEFLGPEAREASPHLGLFDLPRQFDDGIIVGRAKLSGKSVLVAAQEGRFMGGAFGEVHGAKLTGLLRAARKLGQDVVILFDTGGVRLQEANAGELAISEIIRAIVEARTAGCSVIGLIGGRAGCYGGGGIIAGCCSHLIVSEQGRISVSGPEVIETNRGIEEFDSRDRAFVWRTMGGKHRYLIGGADDFVDDDATGFRAATVAALAAGKPLTRTVLEAEQHRLTTRLARFGKAQDGYDVWKALGMAQPEALPGLAVEAFLDIARDRRETSDDAR
ncbi:biotin-independent malonate decarboxylase subunit beta [Acidisoma cellulosilytica]|uniref:Biotin-independent malonate decarboxylase subunit beta n=1 Tax=Acidisoma cellulosilyticum TaxID=2802395 RepID=A0A964E4Y6_9PROT|nr:biotin-independent malonate decarboxylase subunit beta [Acidisoma cellulosilyticum]MCB8881433.1 biotin-independent malonate decarboxylase subunit beta [Acidisoma cellulosilyticum]